VYCDTCAEETGLKSTYHIGKLPAGVSEKTGPLHNPGELIYHLHYAALLKQNYMIKPKTDTDLDPVRNEEYFKKYMHLFDEGKVILKNKNLYIQTKAHKFFVTELIEETIEPLWITPQISEAPNKKAAAFIAMYKKEPHIFILTVYGLLIKVTLKSLGSMDSVFYCNIVWQPETKGILYYIESTLFYYELKENTIIQVFWAPGEYGDDYIGSITAYRFISPTVIRFMGDGYLEYSFAGEEYEIRLDGTGFHKVPEGQIEHGEDLGGAKRIKFLYRLNRHLC